MNEIPPKSGTGIPKKPVIPPPSAPKSPAPTPPRRMNSGALPGRKIYTKEEKLKYLEKRNQTSIMLRLLQIVTILFVLGVFIVHLAVKANLDPANKYLSLMGLSNNTEQKHKKLSAKNTKLTQQIDIATKANEALRGKLSKKEFFLHNDLIQSIRDQDRVQWFDRVTSDNKKIPGIFDTFDKVVRYFSSVLPPQQVRGGSKAISDRDLLQINTITITNINANQEQVNFSVEAFNGFSKAFFLSAEFTEVINSFSFFKNGQINNFSRGSDFETMNFNLNVEVQKEEDIDPADRKHREFEVWEKANIIQNTDVSTDAPIVTGEAQGSQTSTPRTRKKK